MKKILFIIVLCLCFLGCNNSSYKTLDEDIVIEKIENSLTDLSSKDELQLEIFNKEIIDNKEEVTSLILKYNINEDKFYLNIDSKDKKIKMYIGSPNNDDKYYVLSEEDEIKLKQEINRSDIETYIQFMITYVIYGSLENSNYLNDYTNLTGIKYDDQIKIQYENVTDEWENDINIILKDNLFYKIEINSKKEKEETVKQSKSNSVQDCIDKCNSCSKEEETKEVEYDTSYTLIRFYYNVDDIYIPRANRFE